MGALDFPGAKIQMDLLRALIRETERASRVLGLEVRREMPSSVELVDQEDIDGCASREWRGTDSGNGGEGREGRAVLFISADLRPWIDEVIRKEAVVNLMVPEVDRVPQVHDLAWYYSGSPRWLWERCRARPEGPFHDYDPFHLLSLLGRDEALRVIGYLIRVLNWSAEMGSLDLEIYLTLLNRMVWRDLRINQSDIRVMEVISRNPRATTSDMRRTGLSGSSVARSIRKLRTLGIIFGPENVNHLKLGLVTLVVTFPNVRRCRRVFWKFPYTYSMYIPISSGISVHAYLSYPFDGVKRLEDLLRGVGNLSVVRAAMLDLSLGPPSEEWRFPFDFDLDLGQERRKRDLPELRVSKPSIPLDREDLRVLNIVLRDGRVSQSVLRREGISNPRERLRKLREGGFIRRMYLCGLPRGLEKTLIRVRADFDRMEVVHGVLRSFGTVLTHYLEGSRFEGVLAHFMSHHRERGDAIRLLKALFGDSLQVAEDFMDVEPGWRIPLHLWREETNSFDWETPLGELASDLSSCGK